MPHRFLPDTAGGFRSVPLSPSAGLSPGPLMVEECPEEVILLLKRSVELLLQNPRLPSHLRVQSLPPSRGNCFFVCFLTFFRGVGEFFNQILYSRCVLHTL